MISINKMLVCQAVLDILSDGITRSTEQVLHEFSAEYPEYFKSIQNAWIGENGLSCGAVQHPNTIISQILEDLASESKVNKIVQGKKLWTIAS